MSQPNTTPGIVRHFWQSKKRYLLLFLNGFLLASVFYFYMEDNYEQSVFTSIASYAKEKAASLPVKDQQEALLLESMNLTNYLGEARLTVFQEHNFSSIKSDLIHPVTFDLMTGKGACGSFAYVLSRILTELNVENRIAQMKVNDVYAGHNVVEAKTAYGWVVLDPIFKQLFRRPDGKLASFSDISQNWAYYSAQLSDAYNREYRYTGVRYTNWEKVPVLMPALRKAMEWTIGEERTATFSMRTFFLRKFHLLFIVSLLVFCMTTLLMLKGFFRIRKVRHEQADPVIYIPDFSRGNVLQRV